MRNFYKILKEGIMILVLIFILKKTFLTKDDKNFIENINIKLNTIVYLLKNNHTEQAIELANKIAFSIPISENFKDDFWRISASELIRTVILALAEDVVSGKRETIDMFAVADILRSSLDDLNDFINYRENSSLAKYTYENINLMGFRTKNTVINEAFMSIKFRLK